MNLTRLLTLALSPLVLLCFSACMEQTVTDSSGNVIYEKTVSGTPWQSPETTRKQVQETEEALGLR